MDFENKYFKEMVEQLSVEEKYIVEDVINCLCLEKMKGSTEFISKLAELLDEV